MQDKPGMLASVRAKVIGLRMIALSVIAAGVLLTGAGCSSGSSSASQALVRSMNVFITNTPNDTLSLFANTTFLASSMEFGQVGNSGGFAPIQMGTYNLFGSLQGAAGASMELDGVVFNGNNTPYTVVGAGQLGQAGNLKPQIFVMPNFTSNQIVLASGQAAVRIVNLSLNPNPIGLYSTAAGVPTTPVTAATSPISYGYSTLTNGYVPITASTLTNMAIVDPAAPDTVLTLSATSNLNTSTLVSGDAYTLIIFGQPGNASQPLGCVWLQDFPTP